MEFSNENENLVSVEAWSTLPLQMFVEKTGNERVDAALDLLQDSSDLSTEEKQLLFEDIHRRLQDTLSDLS
jgi:hypothetical protein